MSRPRTSTGCPRSSSTTGKPACATSRAANRPAGPLQGRAHGLEPDCFEHNPDTACSLLHLLWAPAGRFVDVHGRAVSPGDHSGKTRGAPMPAAEPVSKAPLDASEVLPSSCKTAGRLLLFRVCVSPADNDNRVPSWSGLAEDGFQGWRGGLLQLEGGVTLDPAQQDGPHLRTKLG